MKYFIFQGNEHDCGFACIKMLLADIAKDKSYLYIAKPSKKGNYTLKDLSEIAKSFNVSLEASTCNDEYLNYIKAPCLALINSNHVVLIKKKKKNKILIYDPGSGITWYSLQEFKKIWSRIILEVNDSKSITKIKKIRRCILPRKMEIIHTLISFVSVAAIMGCFFFLNDTKNIWYSLSFLLLFGLTQIIENLCVYYQINYFDETYIPLYFKNKNNQTKNKYYELLDFKRNFFVSKRTLISSILLAISIAFVLCFNDFRNILIILILVLLKCLEMLLLSKRNKNTENLVGELEAKGLDFSKDNSGKLLLANRCSNQKVLKDSIRNLLFMGLSFLLALLMMVITNNSGCNFVIFYFVVYYAEIRAWSDVLELISKKQNKLKYECKFFDNCNL